MSQARKIGLTQQRGRVAPKMKLPGKILACPLLRNLLRPSLDFMITLAENLICRLLHVTDRGTPRPTKKPCSRVLFSGEAARSVASHWSIYHRAVQPQAAYARPHECRSGMTAWLRPGGRLEGADEVTSRCRSRSRLRVLGKIVFLLT